MTADGIIFDVDGTLWDCTDAVAAGWSRFFGEQPDLKGLSITGRELRQLFGKPLAEIGAILFQGLPDPRRKELLRQCYEEEYKAIEQSRPGLYEGMGPVLQTLSRRFPLFIVSNCQGGYIERFLKVTGMGSCFGGHLCPDDSGMLKADNIRLMTERHHLKRAVYIGDTALDCAASREAGVSFIFAAYGFGQADQPDAVIRKPEDLLALFP